MSKQVIIAHRGESYLAPENTLAAIHLAWEGGADAIEVDVRLTKDHQIVVIHDANTRRLSGINRRIRHTDLNELKKLDVGQYKDEKYKGETIPTLQEVLNTVPHDKKILIEIKSGRNMVPYLKNIIENSELKAEQIEIISFNINTLVEVRKQIPQLMVFWILAFEYYWIRKCFGNPINRIIKKALKNNLHGLDVRAGNMLDHEMIKKVKSSKLKLYVWTVNNPEKIHNLFIMGVDGITTDRANWIVNQLDMRHN